MSGGEQKNNGGEARELPIARESTRWCRDKGDHQGRFRQEKGKRNGHLSVKKDEYEGQAWGGRKGAPDLDERERGVYQPGTNRTKGRN